MKKITLGITSLFLALTLNSCNTFIGATRDLQGLGSGLENTAHGKTWTGGPQGPLTPLNQ